MLRSSSIRFECTIRREELLVKQLQQPIGWHHPGVLLESFCSRVAYGPKYCKRTHTGFSSRSPLRLAIIDRRCSMRGPTFDRNTRRAWLWRTSNSAIRNFRTRGAKSQKRPARDTRFDSCTRQSRYSLSRQRGSPTRMRFVAAETHLDRKLSQSRIGAHSSPMLEFSRKVRHISSTISGKTAIMRDVSFLEMISTWYGSLWMPADRM